VLRRAGTRRVGYRKRGVTCILFSALRRRRMVEPRAEDRSAPPGHRHGGPSPHDRAHDAKVNGGERIRLSLRPQSELHSTMRGLSASPTTGTSGSTRDSSGCGPAAPGPDGLHRDRPRSQSSGSWSPLNSSSEGPCLQGRRHPRSRRWARHPLDESPSARTSRWRDGAHGRLPCGARLSGTMSVTGQRIRRHAGSPGPFQVTCASRTRSTRGPASTSATSTAGRSCLTSRSSR
jgi:hypothetical protein